jgi:short-subunit dehydrogenase
MSRKVAVITGASAGLGAAFARELADRGYDLVLVARRRERLDKLARSITKAKETSDTKIEIVAVDLADRGMNRVVVETALARFARVDLLVNNAGFAVRDRFSVSRWQEQRDLAEVLMVSPCELTHRLLPAMRHEGHGRIINVASLAAFCPELPGSLYPATKKFLVSFTRALNLELQGTDIRASALCPGFTRTEFHDVLGNRERVEELPEWMWMDAEDVVVAGLEGSEQGREIVIPGKVNKALAILAAVVPYRLAVRLTPKAVLERSD